VKLSLSAPAKINLDLRVLAREDSGYHRIETLFLMVDLCDRVIVESAEREIELEVEGADVGPIEENLAYRAAEAFLSAAGLESGVRISLQKEIPAGAGLGGGSSDAAAVLRLLDHLHPEIVSAERLFELGAALGADVPFFLCGGAYALGWGRGGRLLTLPPPENRWVVLALPGLHASTPDAYRAISAAGLEPGRPRLLPSASASDWDWIARVSHNDFERVVFQMHPELASVRERLDSHGGRPSRMSGSGSSVFGIFESEDRATRVAGAIEEAEGVRCVVAPTLGRWSNVQVMEG